MKQKNQYIWTWLLTVVLGISSFTLSSCSDSDGSGGGQPVITGVRTTDPAKADSLFRLRQAQRLS